MEGLATRQSCPSVVPFAELWPSTISDDYAVGKKPRKGNFSLDAAFPLIEGHPVGPTPPKAVPRAGRFAQAMYTARPPPSIHRQME